MTYREKEMAMVSNEEEKKLDSASRGDLERGRVVGVGRRGPALCFS